MINQLNFQKMTTTINNFMVSDNEENMAESDNLRITDNLSV
jgi:hypothetical protein